MNGMFSNSRGLGDLAKYGHIVEVGLSLLANASTPVKFWDEAFLCATYLINMLPSKVINHATPME
jgi:histone deacetylase 1/2